MMVPFTSQEQIQEIVTIADAAKSHIGADETIVLVRQEDSLTQHYGGTPPACWTEANKLARV